ncbi:voltage-gated potassium channel [Evansella vedderi]|uniref:Voltage-gated potassium channel n=1 Tax=Evansella vedderi TaxID=38282 RepID=A0ABU0A2R1_9BACI|nr:potassium channel family protein [Evansella vedderi]MDQ0257775.1 voltage-gated potassium channel [Evansella vedderi]
MRRLVVAYEIIMFSLALMSVLFIWSNHQTVLMLDWGVWFIFVIDVSVRFILSKDKKRFIKENPFDFIAVIPLDSIFRLARIVRLIRVMRMLLIGVHFIKPIVGILKTNGLNKVIGFTTALILFTAIPIYYLEPAIETYQDALWWSMVTATTVGYGDIAPVTGAGRMIAVVLMVVGIGLIGMVTSSIATYFIKEKPNTSGDSTIDFIKSEMNRINDFSTNEIDNLISLLQKYKQEKQNIQIQEKGKIIK